MNELEEKRLLKEYSSKKETHLDKAIKLDKKAKLPANIFAYSFGIIGALIFGIGMCMTMEVIGSGLLVLIFGIIIGVIGIIIISLNYPIYLKILENRKSKYAIFILNELSQKDE